MEENADFVVESLIDVALEGLKMLVVFSDLHGMLSRDRGRCTQVVTEETWHKISTRDINPPSIDHFSDQAGSVPIVDKTRELFRLTCELDVHIISLAREARKQLVK